MAEFERPPEIRDQVILFDGDAMVYRIGFAAEDYDEVNCLILIRQYLDLQMRVLRSTKYRGFVTCNQTRNFREQVAVTAPYKGNRDHTKRPRHYELVREYLKTEWGFQALPDAEADDGIAIAATELRDGAVICAIDKDFLQVPGWNYNPNNGNFKYVSEEAGRRFFYTQILTGDTSDNIIGIRGIGPVKAGRILAKAVTDDEMWTEVLRAFHEHHLPPERAIENGRLLHLQRSPGELWEPPFEKLPTWILPG